MVSFMDNSHVLLDPANKRDYLHAWVREGRVVVGCQFFSLTGWWILT